LRDLTSLQARRVLDQIKIEQNRTPLSGGSLWDDRVQDTWIDKL
jgi:hypothetical protein